MNLKKLSKNNNGFTLIELIIAITISLMIILGVSSIFKFVIISWNKTSSDLEALEKMSAIEHMLRTQFENFEPLKNERNRLFFYGNSEELSFATNNSGSYEEGLVFVNYAYNENDKILKICINTIKDYNDVKNVASEKEKLNCFEISNLNKCTRSYDLKNKNDEISDKMFYSIPNAIIVSMEIKINEKNKLKRKFYVYAED
jgi:prepilin-type N-terminal cleavage/methylation domain-containing protein